jgi:competence protein ComGC
MTHRRRSKTLQHGKTLLEISAFLLVLMVLAGLGMPHVSGNGKTGMNQTSEATLQTVKSAMP